MIVRLQNIATIEDYTFDLPENGITQLVGDNSNGKSVLIEALAFVANNRIKTKLRRENIINDNCNIAYITMSRNGMTLRVTVSRDLSECKYEFTDVNGNTTVRTVREGGLEKLTEKFGWLTYDNSCLQIRETYGHKLFINMDPELDYKVLDSIAVDQTAELFYELYSKKTLPELKDTLATMRNQKSSLEARLSSLKIYDMDKYMEVLSNLKRYYANISKLKMYTPSRLHITSNLKYVEVPKYTPTKLPIFRVMNPAPEFRSLKKEISDYHTILNGTCPLCNTKIKDQEVHTHDS